MQRNSFPWIWVVLAAILLLLPGRAGRLLLDVLGGVTLLLLLLPLLAAGAGWLVWQGLRSRLHTCAVCGVTSFATVTCPACGTSRTDGPNAGATDAWISLGHESLEPSHVTIDVEVVDGPASGGGEHPSSS